MTHQPLLPCPQRLRHLPERFNWVDHRLVRTNLLVSASPEALSLYLFLLVVANAQGLSYYSDLSISKHLPLDICQLEAARGQLVNLELIAWERPYYQVLEVPHTRPTHPTTQKEVSS